MKKLIILVFVLSTASAFAQSRSFQALQAKFQGKKNVHAFSVNGMLCRIILKATTANDEALQELTRNIRHVRIIVIPQDEFVRQQASLSSFKSYMKKDEFEELIMVKKHHDHVSLYRREDDKKNPRYFLLVEEPDQVVAVEMRGDIDPELFKDGNNKLTSSNR
jgi:Domain of unknown function (DUF4252)